MGLFSKKYCSICGGEIALLGNTKLKDGNCCKNCIDMLSPFFKEHKQAKVSDIKYQVECRRQNIEKVNNFAVTRTMGLNTRVLVDETKKQFIVANSKNYRSDNADVIDCSSITNCSVVIEEHRKEILYKDSNDNIKSFNPPCYACSYDFYVNIAVDIPYIDVIRIKINDLPIDNGQSTLIRIEGGLFSKVKDALMPAKSNNGKTSNADEVRMCPQYQMCEQISNEIKSVLMGNRTAIYMQNQSRVEKVVCPWCGTKVLPNDRGVCERCCGILE